MIENLLSTPMIIVYAILFGITMKIADLFNEHGLRWFKGDAILFGILWSLFGVLLILSHNIIANIILAMNIAFIIRNRLDYLNHRIASSIIILSFLFFATFQPWLFLTFFFVFLIFGSLRDFVGDKIKKKGSLLRLYDNFMWYYPVPALIYSILYGNWIVFWALFVFTISYDLTKYVAKTKGYK